MSLYEYGQVCYVSMGNLVSMSVDVYLYMWRCMCRQVYVYLWLFGVRSYVHIFHLYVRYDYVQRCEDTVSVELRYIN